MEEAAGGDRSGERLIRSALKSFVMLGNGPVGTIDVPAYVHRLCEGNRRALTDDNFVDEIVYAHLSSPRKARNGVRLWRNRGGEASDLFYEIVHRSGGGRNVKIIVGDPNGRNIFCDRLVD